MTNGEAVLRPTSQQYAAPELAKRGGDMRILIKNGLILTLDKEDHVYKGYDVLVEDDLITQIDKETSEETGPAIDKVIDASEKLVMPGLVNAHLHSHDAYMKGLYEDLPLEIWSPYVNLALHRPLTQREIYVRTLLLATEMLRNGITTAHDDLIIVDLDEESVDTVMKAYRDSGIRAVVGVRVANKLPSQTMPYLGEIFPIDLRESLDSRRILPDSELVDLCRSMIRRWNGKDDRLHVALAPSAPQRCTDEFMLALDNLSRQHNLPFSTHVLETKVQLVTGLEFYGKSIVEHLWELGVLTRRLTIIHGVWVKDRDIQLLAEGKTSVVHNPVSNLRLGDGIAPVRKMLKAGINVALGCDNSSANDAQNMFEAMKLAALLPEIAGPEFATWRPAREALRMATAGGARSVLLQDAISSLEVGKRADIILLDLTTHSFTPLNDPVRQLVYSESGQSVDTVLVNGRVVMENKEVLTVQTKALLEEANEVGLLLREEHERAKQAADMFRPYLERMYWRCVEQDMGINAYSGTPKPR